MKNRLHELRVSGLALAVGLCLLVSSAARGEVKVFGLFSDHMVLQREMSVPVWGTAAPDEKVTVKFRDQEKTAVADKAGKWMVKLDALKAGGPDKLTIAGANTIAIDDVLVGEVWVGSGQSNMAMFVKSYTAGDPVLAKAAAGSYPRLRMLTSPNLKWVAANPANNESFSALLFSFGVPLQKELDVPVGLMVGAVGGTPSGRWVNAQDLEADAACREATKKFIDSGKYDAAVKKYESDLAAWEKTVATMAAEARQPAGGPATQPATQAAPKAAQAPRRPVAPAKPGDYAARGDLYRDKIVPLIPYAIRGVLWDQGESGTNIGWLDQYTVMGALIRGWRKDWDQGDFAFLHVQKPSGGGCAWDPNDPVTNKAEKFTALPAAIPTDIGDREMHIRISQYPNTYIVPATDLGSGTHPTNKSGYGERAARVALGTVYGKKVETSGPVYESHAVEGGKVRIKFAHVGQGLAIGCGAQKLQGFMVAGENHVFYWADAVIDGQTVVVSCDKVPKPAAVRYAWSARASWANLFNKDGLPAMTFRTDSW